MKKLILILGFISLFTSCDQTKKENFVPMQTVQKDHVMLVNQLPDEGYTLMKTYCYACHNPNTKSHDEILAPPLIAVKIRYKRAYDNKNKFINAMVNLVQNPDEENALMYGAVKRFKMMPKLPLPTKDLEKIANYIYENDLEQPEWMEEHMKEMKGKMGGL